MKRYEGDAYERLAATMDLAASQRWSEAISMLQPLRDPIARRLIVLFSKLERRDRRHAENLADARHEIGNALSIACANIEGIIDGVVPASPQRLADILASLVAAGKRLDRLHQRAN